MAIQRTRGTVRASKGYAVFRIIFGVLLLGLGMNQYSRFSGSSGLPYFSLTMGALFIGYGIWALVAKRTLGNRVELETEVPSTEERFAEITRLKANGVITEQEFEAKRQEILKDL
jgi:hypothetical protein